MEIEEIENNKELNRIVALKLGKMPYEDVADEDFARIEEISLNSRLINGEESGISLSAVRLFPKLQKLRLSNYKITKEAIGTIASLAGLRDLEIFGAEFEEGIDFSSLEHSLKSLRFYNCLEVNFLYPSLEEVWLTQTDIDFSNINLLAAKRLAIRNCKIKNVQDLTDFPNLEGVNFDGSQLINANDEEVQDIKVNSKTKYTHKAEIELTDRIIY